MTDEEWGESSARLIAGTRLYGAVSPRTGNFYVRGPCGHSHILRPQQAEDLAAWLLTAKPPEPAACKCCKCRKCGGV